MNIECAAPLDGPQQVCLLGAGKLAAAMLEAGNGLGGITADLVDQSTGVKTPMLVVVAVGLSATQLAPKIAEVLQAHAQAKIDHAKRHDPNRN